MCLDAEGTERHGAGDEVAYDALHGFHLVEGNWRQTLLPTEEVAKEDGFLLFVHQLGPLLEFRIRTEAGGNLQAGDGFGVPGVEDAVLPVGELSVVLQILVTR